MRKVILLMLIFFFISGTFTVLLSPASGSNLIADSWNTKSPMNQPRQGIGVVAINEKIYAIGGVASGSFVGTNERYDPKTDTWVTLEPMSTPRGYFSIVAYKGKIYCMGGYIRSGILGGDNSDTHSLANECYDIATNSWSTKANVPFSGGGYNAHVVDDQIFVIDGLSGDLFVYDPVDDSWTKKTCIPAPDDFSSSNGHFALVFSAAIDSKILVNFWYPTSSAFDSNSEKVMLYDTKTGIWCEGQVTPKVFSPLKGGAVAGATMGIYAPQRVYIFPISTNNNMVYDPILDEWSTVIEAMPAVGSGVNVGVAVVDDVFYIIGGTLNYQYVPIGYRSTAYTTSTPSNSASSEPEPFGPSEPFLNPQIVAVVLALMVSVVVIGLFFYFKKRKGNVLAHE